MHDAKSGLQATLPLVRVADIVVLAGFSAVS